MKGSRRVTVHMRKHGLQDPLNINLLLPIFQIYFGKELYMFRTDLLSIIRSFNTVLTAIGICHTSCVDWGPR